MFLLVFIECLIPLGSNSDSDTFESNFLPVVTSSAISLLEANETSLSRFSDGISTAE